MFEIAQGELTMGEKKYAGTYNETWYICIGIIEDPKRLSFTLLNVSGAKVENYVRLVY